MAYSNRQHRHHHEDDHARRSHTSSHHSSRMEDSPNASIPTSPDLLFCVELGLLVRSRNTSHGSVSTLMDEVSARLRQIRIHNHIHTGEKSDSYKDWTISEDLTIPPQPLDHRFGIRLISPFFVFGPDRANTWTSSLEELMAVLNHDFELTTHHQCSTSVHVVPARGYWRLSEAQKVASGAIYFERCFDALMPLYRRHTVFAKSNRHNAFLGRRSVPECIAAIERARTFSDLAYRLNLCSANSPTGVALNATNDMPHDGFRWNFRGINGAENGCGTIEFRQPPGSTDATDAVKWIMLVCSFVRLSCAYQVLPETKPSLFSLGEWLRWEARVCGFEGCYRRALKSLFQQGLPVRSGSDSGEDGEVISSDEARRLRWLEDKPQMVGQQKFKDFVQRRMR